jgi:hypothetical protein
LKDRQAGDGDDDDDGDSGVDGLPSVHSDFKTRAVRHGKWLDYFRPIWDQFKLNYSSDNTRQTIEHDSARVIIFKKVLLLIDKHFHCKDTAVSFNMGLKIWQAEFRNIVPFELVEYVPTKYEQFLRILSPLFLEGYTRLACSICNQLFAEPRDRVNSRRDLCLSCKAEQSTLEIQYYSIESYIRRVLLIPAYSQCCSKEFIEHRLNQPTTFGDVLQGGIFRDKYRELVRKEPSIQYLIVFMIHNDSIKLLDFPVSSVTPMLAVNLALPLNVRFKFGAIICLALFPRMAKNIENLSLPIIRELDKLAVSPFTADIAHSDGKTSAGKVGLINLCFMNDLKATPLINGQKQAPAINGACSQCFIQGISTKCTHKSGSTYYLGMVRQLPVDHGLREEYKKEFVNVPISSHYHVLTTFWNMAPMRPKTYEWWRTKALESDKSKFEEGHKSHPSNSSGIKKTTEFSKIVNPLRQVRDDCAHMIKNGICDLFKEISGAKGYKLTKQDIDLEVFLGRSFAKGLVDKKLPPWQASANELKQVNKIVPLIAFWSCAETLREPFRNQQFKIAESFMYAGPLGHFIIESLPSIIPAYRALYHTQISIYAKLLFRFFPKENIELTMAQNFREVIYFLSKGEILLPIKRQKITRHQLAHSWGEKGSIPELGSGLEWSMLGAERWGSFLKTLARGCRKKVERSVHLKYILMSGLDLFRSQNPHLFELVPLASTLASTIIDNRFLESGSSIHFKKECKEKYMLSISDRVRIHHLNLKFVPEYARLFHEYADERKRSGEFFDVNDISSFAEWPATRKLSTREIDMQLGPPLVAEKYLFCFTNGIELRGDDFRKHRNNSGCCMRTENGSTCFGTIEYFVRVRNCLQVPSYNFAVVDWHEACQPDGLTRMQVVFLRAKSQQAIQFASGNRMVELPNLKAKNIIFQECPRHWGAKYHPATSARVVLFNAHQLHQ